MQRPLTLIDLASLHRSAEDCAELGAKLLTTVSARHEDRLLCCETAFLVQQPWPDVSPSAILIFFACFFGSGYACISRRHFKLFNSG